MQREGNQVLYMSIEVKVGSLTQPIVQSKKWLKILEPSWQRYSMGPEENNVAFMH